MREEILGIINRVFDVDTNTLSFTDDDDLVKKLGWDSMDVIDLMMEFDERWRLKLVDNPPNKISVNELLRLIEAKSSATG